MGPSELLSFVTGVFERLGIPYFVTGSVATTVYGEPRFTNDIDLVVVLQPEQVAGFCREFQPPDFFCFEPAILESVRTRTMFNVIHVASGFKIDLIPASDSEYDETRLARVCRIRNSQGPAAWFASPEDVILKKLEYYLISASQKHIRDILGILRVQGLRIDRPYLKRWVERLGLQSAWEVILTSEMPESDPPSHH